MSDHAGAVPQADMGIPAAAAAARGMLLAAGAQHVTSSSSTSKLTQLPVVAKIELGAQRQPRNDAACRQRAQLSRLSAAHCVLAARMKGLRMSRSMHSRVFGPFSRDMIFGPLFDSVPTCKDSLTPGRAGKPAGSVSTPIIPEGQVQTVAAGRHTLKSGLVHQGHSKFGATLEEAPTSSKSSASL